MTTATGLQTVPVLTPGSDVNAYIASVGNIAILTVEQEQELARRFFHEEDVEGARQLVMAHLRFVVHIAKSYSGYGLQLSDLIQEGNVGLMKAVKRFDPDRGVRLVSFAVHWIKAEIHEYVIRNWRIVKVATTKAQRKLFFNLRGAKKRLGWLNNTEVEAVAKDLGVEPKTVRQMEQRLSSYDPAFDAGVDDDDESAYQAPAFYLEDHSANPETQLEDANWEASNTEMLMGALDELDERSQDILRKRWLSEKKSTLHELAAEYGVSAERIRQLEKNGMKKIKVAMAA